MTGRPRPISGETGKQSQTRHRVALISDLLPVAGVPPPAGQVRGPPSYRLLIVDIRKALVDYRNRRARINYWRQRLGQHTADHYHDARISKLPEDLWLYERIIWEMHADTVIELGVQHGGSTLWFRDRLKTLNDLGKASRHLVIAVDPSLSSGAISRPMESHVIRAATFSEGRVMPRAR